MTYMLLLNGALKLVEEIILCYSSFVTNLPTNKLVHSVRFQEFSIRIISEW